MATDKYEIGSRPEEERLFTTREVADLCGYKPASMIQIYKKLNIVPGTKVIKGTKTLVFTWQQTQILIRYSKESIAKKLEMKKKAGAVKLAGNITIEELKLLHPLVTDERFFKTEFFPEVVPDCFAEIDAWAV